MSASPAISRPLLILLVLTLVVGGVVATRTLFGADASTESGFDGPVPVEFDGADDAAPARWVPPDQPRNPFLPFVEIESGDASDDTADADLNGDDEADFETVG